MQNYYPIGLSTLQIPIFIHEWENNNKPRILILGGVHGDEIEGVVLARHLVQYFLAQPPTEFSLMIIPEMNPDGVLMKTRGNGNGVDINRNLPTKDWSAEIKTPRYHPGPAAGSEIENQLLMKLIEDKKPQLIFSLHSWKPVLNVNGDCLPEANIIAKFTNYPVDTEIGYPTPGCLGTYTGLERNIGTLTYEIERGQAVKDIGKFHTPGIIAALTAAALRFK